MKARLSNRAMSLISNASKKRAIAPLVVALSLAVFVALVGINIEKASADHYIVPVDNSTNGNPQTECESVYGTGSGILGWKPFTADDPGVGTYGPYSEGPLTLTYTLAHDTDMGSGPSNYLDSFSVTGGVIDSVIMKASNGGFMYRWGSNGSLEPVTSDSSVFTYIVGGEYDGYLELDMGEYGNNNGLTRHADGILHTPYSNLNNEAGKWAGTSHVTFCYFQRLDVEKTADGDWNEDVDWSITKTVVDADIFDGEDAVFNVDVTLDSTSYIDTVVSGTITATNNFDTVSAPTSLDDTVEFGGNTYEYSVNIGVLAPGESTTVGYSVNIGTVPSVPAGGTNTVSAAAAYEGSGWAESASVTVPITWVGPNTTFDATVDVYDAFQGGTPVLLGTAPTDGSSFEVTLSYLAAGEYNNVACIMDDGVEECDNDDVTVHQLSVVKTGAGAYQVDHNWSIEKTVRDANIFVGEDAVFDVAVTEDASDDVNVSVSGTISITNPSPDSATVSLGDNALVNPTYSVGNIAAITVPGNSTVDVAYTDNRADNSDLSDFTNFAVVVNPIGGNVQAASVLVSFTAGDPIDATVDVTDNFANTGSSSIGTGAGTYVVTRSGLAAGSYNNVACIDSDNGVIECDNDDVTVHQLSVEKTGAGAYQVDNNWLITKAVRDGDIFVGENAVFDVVVSEDGSDDVNVVVAGTISITNPSPDSTTVSLVDAALVNPSYNVGNIAAISVPGNSTVVVNYTDPRDNNTSTADFTNDAVVTNSIGGDEQTGSVLVSFTAGDEIDATVDVHDTFNGGTPSYLGTTPTDGYSYVVTIEDLTAGSYNNVACVSDTGTGANALDCDNDDVNVYDLSVSKTAGTSFDRELTYGIEKSVQWWDAQAGDPGVWVDFVSTNIPQIEAGESVDVRYNIDVTATVGPDADSAHTVTGVITVTNNNPMDDAVINLVDEITGGGFTVDVVDQSSVTIAAGQTLTIDYSVVVDALGDKALSLNSVSVVNVSGNGTTYGDTASVSWPDSAGDLLNPAWSVVDTGIVATAEIGGETVVLGEITAASLTLSGDVLGTAGFNGGSGQVTIGGNLNDLLLSFQTHNAGEYCGDVTWSNTATVFANGDPTSDDAVIVIEQSCGGVLTRTPGYWKTHNDTFNGGDDKGGPRTDPTWYTLGPDAEGTEFFESGYSWYQVLWLADKGNPWNTLARHYAAAAMNVAAGTSTTDLENIAFDFDGDGIAETVVSDVLAEAALWLDGTSSGDGAIVDAILRKFPDSFPTRKQLRKAFVDLDDNGSDEYQLGGKDIAHFFNAYYPMLALAEYIDDYNNGIVGPGHGD
ncbi:hypothetical protein JYU04_02230 [Dehalococcoides mccartyi]|nr:hypothetical protein [Dehalococcoides mccartyi]